jgi:hypothetical protein
MSARFWGGDECVDDGSACIAFKINQLFLFFLSDTRPNDGDELFRVMDGTAERSAWAVPGSLPLLNDRYQPDNSFPNETLS